MATRDAYLDGTYQANVGDWHESDAEWKADHVWRLLMDEGVAANVKRLGDVGCGTAGVLDHLAGRLPSDVELVGFEPSPQAVEAARALRSSRVRVVQSDLESAAEGPFDILLVLDVFEHVEDYFTFLRGLHGAADKFVFHIPLDLNVQNVMRPAKIMTLRRTIGHLHYFSESTARATLAECGYEILADRFTSMASDNPQSRGARLLRGPRRLANRYSPAWAAKFLGGNSLLVLARSAQP